MHAVAEIISGAVEQDHEVTDPRAAINSVMTTTVDTARVIFILSNRNPEARPRVRDPVVYPTLITTMPSSNGPAAAGTVRSGRVSCCGGYSGQPATMANTQTMDRGRVSNRNGSYLPATMIIFS